MLIEHIKKMPAIGRLIKAVVRYWPFFCEVGKVNLFTKLIVKLLEWFTKRLDFIKGHFCGKFPPLIFGLLF